MEVRRLFLRAVHKFQMVSPGDRIVLAVSGGPDSIALLQLFLECREELQVDLIVAHMNHGLRGAEAARDAERVEEIARSERLPFALSSVDLKKGSRGESPEALARTARYAFLRQVAAEYRAQKVATAHTLDDQVETVLMRFFREGGRGGLGGIPRVREGFFIRPLLEIPKDQILSYLERQGCSYGVDSTNRDLRYPRNRVRHCVIPMLLKEVNPNLKDRLARLGRVLRLEDEYLDRVAQEFLRSLIFPDGTLDLKGLGSVPEALRARVFRDWMGPHVWCGLVHLDAMLELVSGTDPNGSLSLPGGITFLSEQGRGALSKKPRGPRPENYEYVLEPGKEMRIERIGARILTEISPCAGMGESFQAKDPFTEFFDLDEISGPILLRNRRPGDRIQPLGMRGHKLVSDLFIDKRVPREIRERVPLVLWGEEVRWVPGCARAGSALLRNETKTVLRLTLSWIWPQVGNVDRTGIVCYRH
jgi:tRNA(Ile)-lysidine synthase